MIPGAVIGNNNNKGFTDMLRWIMESDDHNASMFRVALNVNQRAQRGNQDVDNELLPARREALIIVAIET